MADDKVDCIEDRLRSGKIADVSKKSGDRSGSSRRYVDTGLGTAQGTGTGKSGEIRHLPLKTIAINLIGAVD
ncbi:MAG: hypothetical protein DU481_04740 [Nitrosomonas sp.]|uniref:hypothetical protein n=1 Tax=Nitrosomonas sp. TaxID=42353 RepID=UPI0032EBD9E4